MDSLYKGEEDLILTEMSFNCRAMTPTQKLNDSSLNGGNFKDRLMDQFNLDTQIKPAVPDAPATDLAIPEERVDHDLLERERKLQESLSIKPPQKNKD